MFLEIAEVSVGDILQFVTSDEEADATYGSIQHLFKSSKLLNTRESFEIKSFHGNNETTVPIGSQ